MRILVMLNPTNKHGTKMAYTRLRKFLIADGYLMIGPELYMRVTTNRKGAQKHFNRLLQYSPGSGVVRVMRLTEKQYSGIWFLAGKTDYQEATVGKNCHIML